MAMTDPKGFVRLAPPPLSPPVINLVTSSRNPQPVDPETGKIEEHWPLGFAFQPIPNQNPDTSDTRDVTDAAPDISPHPVVQTVPWVIEVEDKCSAFGFVAHDFVGRATAGLQAATPKGLEQEFWTGTEAQNSSWPNLYLAMHSVANRAAGFGPIDVTPTPGTAISMLEGFELLEAAIAGCGAGSRGMIHAEPKAAPNFLGVRREGNLLLTPRDTIVCVGSGYDGSGPPDLAEETAVQSWLYATGIPVTYLDDPIVEPSGGEVQVMTRVVGGEPAFAREYQPGEDDALRLLYEPVGDGLEERFRAYFLDRATNTVRARARRVVAATWDGVCHFAVLVNINT